MRSLPPRKVSRLERAAWALLAVSVLTMHAPSAVAGGGYPDALAEDADAAAFPDPLEPVNRLTFRLNHRLDLWVIDPVTRAYAFVVPTPARKALRRAVANLNSPAVFVNDVLQLEPKDAAVTAGRFAVNTTVGVVGLFDVAERMGLPGHHSDFGQTLALCGVPSGPYLVVPVVGPTTVRDGGGYLVDFLFRPATYMLGPGAPLLVFTSLQEGGAGIAARDAHADELRALQTSSIDYYAAMRSAFAQDRTARIWARRQDRGPLARLRQGLRALALAPSRGEVGDAGAHGVDQGVETLALEN